MILIACVESSFGMCFNGRRVSRDKIVTDRILKLTEGYPLYITDFSKDLFENSEAVLVEDVLNPADKEGYFFVENVIPEGFENIEKIILFMWNRDYPSDLKLKLPENFKEINRFDLKGNSHEKITEVHYAKIT